jgi:hypothetical protein
VKKIFLFKVFIWLEGHVETGLELQSAGKSKVNFYL